MRMSTVILLFYRSVHYLEFELGPFTVFFGKNNAGKTNLLEAIYGVLAPQDMGTSAAVGGKFSMPVSGLRGGDPMVPPTGAVYVELEQGLAFDDAVLAMVPEAVAVPGGMLPFREVPPGHVWFANAASLNLPGLWFVDVRDYFDRLHAAAINEHYHEESELPAQFLSLRISKPRPRPLFLGWEFENIESWVTSAIAELTAVPSRFGSEPRSFALLDDGDSSGAWRVRPEVLERLEQLAMLATDLLPDFLDGSIQPEFHLATGWEGKPRV